MLSRRTLAGAVLLAFAFATPASAQNTVKIGTVLSVTGPAAFLGEPEEKTIKMYTDKARTFATRLVEEDKVVAVLGGSTTGTTLAMIPVFEGAKIPFISFGGAIEIVEPVRKFVYKTPHTDKMACQKIFEDMRARKIVKIGIISSTDGFGKSMREQCLTVAKESGVEFVADETHGPRDADVTPQLTKIKNTPGIQGLVHTGFGQHGAVVTRNVRQVGLTIPLYQNHGVASKSYIELSGEAANGVRLPAAALLLAEKLADNDPQKPVVVAYKQLYEKTANQPVSTFGGHAYDGFFILIDAMKRANSTDPQKINAEIEKTRGFIGTAGIVNMSPTDHLGLDLTAFKMLEIKNGDWTEVQAGSSSDPLSRLRERVRVRG